MKNRSYVALTLATVFLVMLLAGFYLMFFPPVATISQQKESWSDISLPTPIPANGTRQAIFSAQIGDHITFRILPLSGWTLTPMPIGVYWGGSVAVSVYFGSQLLYSNTADEISGTVNLSQTGTYTLQIINDNNYNVVFLSNVAENSYLRLHHSYTEYSQVTNTSLQSLSFVLIMSSIVVGVAGLLIVTVQPKKTKSLLHI